MSTTLAVAAPTASVNPQAQKVQITLTVQEIAFLKRALDVAAGTCMTVPDGCVIGASRAALEADLGAGKPVVAAKK